MTTPRAGIFVGIALLIVTAGATLLILWANGKGNPPVQVTTNNDPAPTVEVTPYTDPTSAGDSGARSGYKEFDQQMEELYKEYMKSLSAQPTP